MTRKTTEAIQVKELSSDSSASELGRTYEQFTNNLSEPSSQLSEPEVNNDSLVVYSTNKVAKLIDAKESTVRRVWAPKVVDAYTHSPNPVRTQRGFTSDGTPIYYWTEFGLQALREYKQAADMGLAPQHLEKVKETYPAPEGYRAEPSEIEQCEAELVEESTPIPTTVDLAVTNTNLLDALRRRLESVKSRIQQIEGETQLVDTRERELTEAEDLFNKIRLEEHRQKCMQESLELRKIELEVRASQVGND